MVKFNSFIESILNNGEASDFKQKYDSRYDFMKVVAMVFIVMWHINQHSAILGGGGGVVFYKAIAFNKYDFYDVSGDIRSGCRYDFYHN